MTVMAASVSAPNSSIADKQGFQNFVNQKTAAYNNVPELVDYNHVNKDIRRSRSSNDTELVDTEEEGEDDQDNNVPELVDYNHVNKDISRSRSNDDREFVNTEEEDEDNDVPELVDYNHVNKDISRSGSNDDTELVNTTETEMETHGNLQLSHPPYRSKIRPYVEITPSLIKTRRTCTTLHHSNEEFYSQFAINTFVSTFPWKE